MKKILLAAVALIALTACDNDARVVSRNISQAADQFEINRRVVFYNTISGEYMLMVEGLCSLGSGQETVSLAVTCKIGPSDYKKHYLGLSRNVSWFAEQMEPAKASKYFYRVTFKPSIIIPDIRVQ